MVSKAIELDSTFFTENESLFVGLDRLSLKGNNIHFVDAKTLGHFLTMARGLQTVDFSENPLFKKLVDGP